ncbi:1,6-anhydro-N-acetylmuramyl-L-alanine amidase AmpD [Vibrio astriarenae]
MIDQNGWYSAARHVSSPHFNQREDKEDISLLVVHNISLPPGKFGTPYIEQFFTGKLCAQEHPFFAHIAALQVSAHCLVRRNGEVVQFVSFQDRAWHAGVSSFAGRDKCNDYSIGIELEGTDNTPYTEAQYQALAQVTQQLMQRYPKMTIERLTGHQYIAPMRKSDPGLVFDWGKFRRLIVES